MGGCGGTRYTKDQKFLSECEEILSTLKLNTVHWKHFIAEVALYGVLAKLALREISLVMKAVGLEKNFSNEKSVLRKFLELLQLDKTCKARDLIVVGLILCKGFDKERGEYLCHLLDPEAASDNIEQDILETMKGIMVIAVKAVPELVIMNRKEAGRIESEDDGIEKRDTKFIQSFIAMDEGILSAATKRWLPLGDPEGDKIIYKKSRIVEWVMNGEFAPMRALEIGLQMYITMNGISTIHILKDEDDCTKDSQIIDRRKEIVEDITK